MTLTTLKRDSIIYRPYAFNDAGKYVDSIVFFNKDGIIYQTRSGWLESNSLKNEIGYISGRDVERIEIETPKLKRKIDFTVKHNFYTTHKEEYGNEIKVTIYILCNDENSVVSVKKVQEEMSETESLGKDINTFKVAEYAITGINEQVIHVTSREFVSTRLTELGKIAVELVEKHKNDEYDIRGIDVYTWIKLLKRYELIPKK